VVNGVTAGVFPKNEELIRVEKLLDDECFFAPFRERLADWRSYHSNYKYYKINKMIPVGMKQIGSGNSPLPTTLSLNST